MFVVPVAGPGTVLTVIEVARNCTCCSAIISHQLFNLALLSCLMESNIADVITHVSSLLIDSGCHLVLDLCEWLDLVCEFYQFPVNA